MWVDDRESRAMNLERWMAKGKKWKCHREASLRARLVKLKMTEGRPNSHRTVSICVRKWGVTCTLSFIDIPSLLLGFPGSTVVKNLPDNAGDTRDTISVPGSGRFSEEGNGKPLQYSCLGNPMDRGAWWAIVQGVTKSLTGLSLCVHAHTHTHTHTHTLRGKGVQWPRGWSQTGW